MLSKSGINPHRLTVGLALFFCLFFVHPAIAAKDISSPTTPVVSDDGATTISDATLHAKWSSSDPQSGIEEYQYKITEGSKTGTTIVKWTSTGTTPDVTKTGLSLKNNQIYYFAVKAKNGAKLWSKIGYSDGIMFQKQGSDTIPPTGTIKINNGASYTTSTSVTLNLEATDSGSGMGSGAQMSFSDDNSKWSTPQSYSKTRSWILAAGDGTKTVYAKFKDADGNWTTVEIKDTIILDTTMPSAPVVTDDGSTTISTTTLHARWSSSGAKSEYKYQIRRDSPSGAVVADWTSAGTKIEVTKSGLTLTTGVVYYFGVKAMKKDLSVWSDVGWSDGIEVVAPATTPIVTDDGSTTASATTLHVKWSSSDTESGITDYQYRILQGSKTGTVVADWTSVGTNTEVTKSGLALTNGVVYYFAVKAKNGAGVWSAIGYSDGIKFQKQDDIDITPPTGTIKIDDGAFYAGTISVTLNLEATDSGSGMGNGAQMSFSNDNSAWSTSEAYAKTKSWTLAAGDGTKTVYARFKDADGNWTTAEIKDDIILDTTMPLTTVVTDDGLNTTSITTLHAKWSSSADKESGIKEYQYLIHRDSPSGAVVVKWTSAGTNTEVTKSGLTLKDGVSYYFGVKAKNGAGLWSEVGWSDGIKVKTSDTTPPATPVVTDDGSITPFTTTLYAKWSSSDVESGITEYQYQIRRDSPSGAVVVDWTSAGAKTEVTKSGLTLKNGVVYYFGVKAKNGAKLWSKIGYSDGIMVESLDNTPPTGTIKINNGASYTTSTSVTLNLEATDSGSGMGSGAQMSFSNDKSNWSAPEAYSKTKSWTLAAGDGTKTVYARFKDVDGNWTTAEIKDTIILDTTEPTIPMVSDDGAVVIYITSLHAKWSSSADKESGIKEYQYQIRRDSPSGAMVVDWTSVGTSVEVTKSGLTLKDGVSYYFGVKAKNGAGLWSEIGWSDGITFQSQDTPPATPIVTDDGLNTASTTTLHAKWSSSDAESGIKEYQYQILQDSKTGAVVVKWTSAGTNTEVTKSGLTLTNKVVYYFGVKAKNGAGLWSEIGWSDGIAVESKESDTTPPTGTIKINNDASYTTSTSVTLNLEATDSGSGMGNGAQMSFSNDNSKWSTPEAYSKTKSWTLATGDGTKTVYAKFKDVDGNWTTAEIKDTIILDTTEPTTPIVSDDGATTTSTTTLHAKWSSSDVESGIKEYRYLIRRDSPTGDVVVGWTLAGINTEVTKSGLTLKDGVSYYFGVEAKNGAGLWSEVGWSDGIRVQSLDTTPPTGTIKINNDASYTTSTSVTLNLEATDSGSGMGSGAQMSFSNDNSKWSTPEAYSKTKSWTLAAGDGPKTVYAKFKDVAGNWTTAYSDKITLVSANLLPGVVVNGSITDTARSKSYNLAASANDKVTIQAAKTSGDNLFVVYLELYSPDGAKIAKAAGRIDKTLPTTGNYTVVVRDDNNGGTGSYSMEYTESSIVPSVDNITPSSGSSPPNQPVTFTTTFSDLSPAGWQDIQTAELLINTSSDGANCFWGYYNQNENKLYLRNDTDTIWIGGYAPQTSNIIENSYAKLDCSKTTVSGSGANLTISWSVDFKSAFSGKTYNIYLYVKDDSGLNSGWQQKGTWSVGAMEIISFLPADKSRFLEGQVINCDVQVQPPNSNYQYQFLVDGLIKRAFSQNKSWDWQTIAGDIGVHTLTVQIKDEHSLQIEESRRLIIYRRPIEP